MYTPVRLSPDFKILPNEVEMSEADTGGQLQSRIDAAKASGDVGEANRLYQEQIGNVDPFGLEPAPVPAVPEAAVEGGQVEFDDKAPN